MSTEEKKMTLDEFRSWLQGVEDMQEEGWTPNTAQWKKIRSKINLITEDHTTVNQSVPYVGQQGAMPQGALSPTPLAPVPQAPYVSSLEQSVGGRVTTFVPPPLPQHLERPKTPDIDTSNGRYDTNFV